MRVVVLLALSISVSFAVECHEYLDSPLVPSILDANNTCTGSYCYRIEYIIKHLAIQPNERSILMGCFDYPIEMTIMGCRQNLEGRILCVCSDVDRCNEDPASNIFDLPVVRNCRSQSTGDGVENDGNTCASHYCITYRMTAVPLR
ncbi:hypothetical protein PENTCL1PPCAC_16098 [Pristionchus entomophagus]|uniref:Activin types I and II receptor domain-containing protein n=1 Tax=Pristionchus entomophagus TaxID=358040 RepID=A0AAV5TI63_9BILA|nr:hypothetical protein PENTCL1PPCAC_16098 [Pristionchus entomophagus]